MNKNKPFTSHLSPFTFFLSFLFWMLVFGFAVRVFEAVVLGYYHEESGKHFLWCLTGFGYDILVFSKFALVLCPVYLLIHHWSPKAAKWTFRVIGALMLLISNAMIMYYISAYLPLDKIFFDYSIKELLYISQSTGSFVWWSYACLLGIPILFLIVSRHTVKIGRWGLFVWLALAIAGLCFWKMPSSGVVCNKQEFFWRSLFDKEALFNRFNPKDLEAQRERILEFQSMFPEDEFVDYRYPFAHVDKSPDVLSSYFNLNPDKKPNLVFVITEGLSREFSGYNCKYPSATPFLDSLADQSLCWLIYLTLTTHDPFDYPNKEQYTQAYIDKLKQHGRLNEIQPSQYEMYASYLYYDDCLRKFFSDYRTMPEYENTIFVITGDHCFNAQSEELDKYHVPLIIWSPMLKEPHRFPAMVAHRDITPSFLAMMKEKYDVKAPHIVSWINTGLDVSPTFRANTFTPQLKNSRKMDNMVYKDYFYDEGKIYKFGYENERLTITPVEEEKIVKLMSDYKAMDDYVMNNDALILLDEDKQQLMLAVDSTQSVNYVLLNTQVSPFDTLERTNTFKLNNVYPFNLFMEPVSDSLESVIVYCNFDIYIPWQENGGKKILLGYALDHPDGNREVIKTLMVNYDWYEYYDRWQHFTMTQSLSKSLVHYQDGDKLMCYFVNGDRIDFLISNFNLQIVGIHE